MHVALHFTLARNSHLSDIQLCSSVNGSYVAAAETFDKCECMASVNMDYAVC